MLGSLHLRMGSSLLHHAAHAARDGGDQARTAGYSTAQGFTGTADLSMILKLSVSVELTEIFIRMSSFRSVLSASHTARVQPWGLGGVQFFRAFWVKGLYW